VVAEEEEDPIDFDAVRDMTRKGRHHKVRPHLESQSSSSSCRQHALRAIQRVAFRGGGSLYIFFQQDIYFFVRLCIHFKNNFSYFLRCISVHSVVVATTTTSMMMTTRVPEASSQSTDKVLTSEQSMWQVDCAKSHTQALHLDYCYQFARQPWP
jgi:hypothetical protein